MRSRRGRRNKRKVRVIVLATITILFCITTAYAAFSTNLTLGVKGNIKEKSRMIKSWNYGSTDDFHNSEYRENIVSITFLNSPVLPDNVERSWDVSVDGKGGVMAYIKINEEDHTKYDLFIGAENGVIANSNSATLFYNFTATKEINFNNNFDTSEVTDMGHMFQSCTNLNALDVSSFNTIKTTTLEGMFQDCKQLTELDLTNFDTRNVTKMHYMFYGCTNLEKLDLSSFDTSKVIKMHYMFNACGKLTTLDVSSFDTSIVDNMNRMFSSCSSLTTIYASDKFTTSSVLDSANMFNWSQKLLGGNGTVFDSNHVDKEYARIDRPSTSGYFTLKRPN